MIREIAVAGQLLAMAAFSFDGVQESDMTIESKKVRGNGEEICLEGAVSLAVEKGPSLHCVQAEIFTEKHRAFLEGNEEEQVVFTDPLGEIRGDAMVVDYTTTEGVLTPLKMLVDGNVRIYSRQRSRLQYALADEAELFFETRKMNLMSRDEGFVLYVDKENNIEMSASKIEASRDEGGIEEVKGVGIVRLVLDDSEIARMKQSFHWDGD